MAKFIKKNVGTTDQVIRFLIGAGFVSVYFLAETQAMQWTGLAIGAVVLLTVVFSFCPVYALFNLNTRGAGRMKGKSGGEGTASGGSTKISHFESRTEAEKARKAAIKAEEEKKKEKEEHKTAA